MNKKEITSIIEKFAPLDMQEKWDCSGWLVETCKQEIKRILLCLTVTDDIIKQAKSNNCDMIISHHPLFKIDCHSELVSEFMKPNIDIYCAHTNLDRAQGGTTDTLINKLGFNVAVVDDFVRYVETSISTDELQEKLYKISDNVRIVNNKNVSRLNKIGFCAGSGSEFVELAQENGADCFVTGDIKFHTAVESDIVLFDIGHFESEIEVLRVFEKLLSDKVEITYANEKSPFKTALKY